MTKAMPDAGTYALRTEDLPVAPAPDIVNAPDVPVAARRVEELGYVIVRSELQT